MIDLARHHERKSSYKELLNQGIPRERAKKRALDVARPPAKKIVKGKKDRDYVDRMKRLAKEWIPLLTREDRKRYRRPIELCPTKLSMVTSGHAA